MEEFGHIDVNLLNDRRDLKRSIAQSLEDLSFAQLAMANVLTNLLFRVTNHWSVSRIYRFHIEVQQTPQ